MSEADTTMSNVNTTPAGRPNPSFGEQTSDQALPREGDPTKINIFANRPRQIIGADSPDLIGIAFEASLASPVAFEAVKSQIIQAADRLPDPAKRAEVRDAVGKATEVNAFARNFQVIIPGASAGEIDMYGSATFLRDLKLAFEQNGRAAVGELNYSIKSANSVDHDLGTKILQLGAQVAVDTCKTKFGFTPTICKEGANIYFIIPPQYNPAEVMSTVKDVQSAAFDVEIPQLMDKKYGELINDYMEAHKKENVTREEAEKNVRAVINKEMESYEWGRDRAKNIHAAVVTSGEGYDHQTMFQAVMRGVGILNENERDHSKVHECNFPKEELRQKDENVRATIESIKDINKETRISKRMLEPTEEELTKQMGPFAEKVGGDQVKEMARAIVEPALFDQDTGLPTYKHFQRVADEGHINPDELVSIVSFDMNRAGQFRALFGDRALDDIIRERIASFQGVCNREFGHGTVTLYRYGARSEEFFLVCRGMTGEQALKVVARLQAHFADPGHDPKDITIHPESLSEEARQALEKSGYELGPGALNIDANDVERTNTKPDGSSNKINRLTMSAGIMTGLAKNIWNIYTDAVHFEERAKSLCGQRDQTYVFKDGTLLKISPKTGAEVEALRLKSVSASEEFLTTAERSSVSETETPKATSEPVQTVLPADTKPDTKTATAGMQSPDATKADMDFPKLRQGVGSEELYAGTKSPEAQQDGLIQAFPTQSIPSTASGRLLSKAGPSAGSYAVSAGVFIPIGTAIDVAANWLEGKPVNAQTTVESAANNTASVTKFSAETFLAGTLSADKMTGTGVFALDSASGVHSQQTAGAAIANITGFEAGGRLAEPLARAISSVMPNPMAGKIVQEGITVAGGLISSKLSDAGYNLSAESHPGIYQNDLMTYAQTYANIVTDYNPANKLKEALPTPSVLPEFLIGEQKYNPNKAVKDVAAMGVTGLEYGATTALVGKTLYAAGSKIGISTVVVGAPMAMIEGWKEGEKQSGDFIEGVEGYGKSVAMGAGTAGATAAIGAYWTGTITAAETVGATAAAATSTTTGAVVLAAAAPAAAIGAIAAGAAYDASLAVQIADQHREKAQGQSKSMGKEEMTNVFSGLKMLDKGWVSGTKAELISKEDIAKMNPKASPDQIDKMFSMAQMQIGYSNPLGTTVPGKDKSGGWQSLGSDFSQIDQTFKGGEWKGSYKNETEYLDTNIPNWRYLVSQQGGQRETFENRLNGLYNSQAVQEYMKKIDSGNLTPRNMLEEYRANPDLQKTAPPSEFWQKSGLSLEE